MYATIRAIGGIVIGGAIATTILAVAFYLLGGGDTAALVMTLVTVGTALDELKDIAGPVRLRRSQSPTGPSTSWYEQYRDEFLANLPRFWFRMAAWSVLAFAGLVIATHFGSLGLEGIDGCPAETR